LVAIAASIALPPRGRDLGAAGDDARPLPFGLGILAAHDDAGAGADEGEDDSGNQA